MVPFKAVELELEGHDSTESNWFDIGLIFRTRMGLLEMFPTPAPFPNCWHGPSEVKLLHLMCEQ